MRPDSLSSNWAKRGGAKLDLMIAHASISSGSWHNARKQTYTLTSEACKLLHMCIFASTKHTRLLLPHLLFDFCALPPQTHSLQQSDLTNETHAKLQDWHQFAGKKFASDYRIRQEQLIGRPHTVHAGMAGMTADVFTKFYCVQCLSRHLIACMPVACRGLGRREHGLIRHKYDVTQLQRLIHCMACTIKQHRLRNLCV